MNAPDSRSIQPRPDPLPQTTQMPHLTAQMPQSTNAKEWYVGLSIRAGSCLSEDANETESPRTSAVRGLSNTKLTLAKEPHEGWYNTDTRGSSSELNCPYTKSFWTHKN